jgi:carbon-monoxide dehydrogenase medium subunit
MEKRLSENFSPDALARVKVAPDELVSDLHASAGYRAHLVGVIAQRAVEASLAGK